jgi:hypothetical protein
MMVLQKVTLRPLASLLRLELYGYNLKMRNKAFLILIASLCMVIAGLTLVNPEHVFAFKPSLDLTNGTTTSSQQMPLQQTTQIPMEAKPKNNTATGGGGGFSFSSNFTALTQPPSAPQPSNASLLSENETVMPSASQSQSAPLPEGGGGTGIDSFQITRVPASERSTSSPAPTSTPLFSTKFGLDRTENVNLDNGASYPIKYKITDGQVTRMSLERTSDGRPSLIVDIVSEATEAENGRLLLEIPNAVLDPNRKLFVFEEYSISKSFTHPEWKELARDPQSVVLETTFFVSVLPGPTTIHIAYR